MFRTFTFTIVLLSYCCCIFFTNLFSQPLEIQFDVFPSNSVPKLLEQPLTHIKEPFLLSAMASAVSFTSLPTSEEVVNEQFGADFFGFPDALLEGCVNVITGDFQELASDFSAPGTAGVKMQRFYCGAGSRKHSLHDGWQLSHGAKLLCYEGKRHLCNALALNKFKRKAFSGPHWKITISRGSRGSHA